MKIKATTTNKIMHSLKERNVILEAVAAQFSDRTTYEVFVEMVEFSVWGFVPSRGTHQKDSFPSVGEELASFTPETAGAFREDRNSLKGR